MIPPERTFAEIPAIEAKRVNGPLMIDGSITDPAWQSAAPATDFLDYSTKRPVSQQTSVRVLYDDQALYISFDCHESRMDILSVTVETQGGPVYVDDSIEIFLSPYPVATEDNYYHFSVNANGVQYAEHNALPDWNRFGWQVATARGNDGWTAEIVIPFETLYARGRGAPFWRVNFTRNEIPFHETSSWAYTGKSFHTPSKFGRLVGIEVPALNIGLSGTMKPIPSTVTESTPQTLNRVFDYAKAGANRIIPEPVSFAPTHEVFRIDEATTKIILPEKATKEDQWAADSLNREIVDRGGNALPVINFSLSKDVTRGGNILLGEPWRNAAARAILLGESVEVSSTSPGPEGYALAVRSDSIAACGSDPRGTFYAVQSLKQILRRDEQGFYFDGCRVFDWPRFAYRGVHLLLDKDSPQIHGKMIEKLFSTYKINNIVLEIEQGYKWQSHPEIANPKSCDRKGVDQLLDLAQKNFITVVPLVQTLGHLEFVFKAHPEIVEDASVPYAYCPLNPKSYELVFDLLDEAIDVFRQPPYLHIGHDEFDMRGTFPTHDECRAIGKPALYEMDTLKIYNYLGSKGVGTMMWGDVLLKKDYLSMVERLPKDIVITDWHYHVAKDFPSVSFFTSRRLEVLSCPWKYPLNLISLSRYASAHNSTGMLQTTWTGYFGNADAINGLAADLYCYILAAAYAWSPDKPELYQSYHAANVFLNLWYDTQRDEAKKGLALDLRPWLNLSIETAPDGEGWLGVNKGHDLSGLPQGVQWLGDGVQYSLPERPDPKRPSAVMLKGGIWGESFPESVSGIPVRSKALAMNFLHCVPWQNEAKTKVASYRVNYADGSSVEIPLVQGSEVFGWLEDGANNNTRTAWLGETEKRSKIFLHSYRWVNPSPDKEISSLDIVSDGPDGPLVVLAITAETQ